ncbi:hypothetical protein [Synechococcus sp. A15-24]|uniref:hypothetical protein n=1 Tax=Synechococcus sp. A15-24 TaxID=1050635 RepID=UPI001646C882|nr:hypothetical protein [Synechococcus sp. A15-24]QNJ27811.1 hypothetical protein SynA1524_00089 [Synechococcus sp. A15-24]
MNYIFTAAGQGSRFKNKGIKPPKPLIKAKGKTLLEYSVESFNYTSSDQIFITTLKRDFVKKYLEKSLRHIVNGAKIYWLEIDNLTPGQLDTTLLTINTFDIQNEFVVHNCDTYFEAGNLFKDFSQSNSAISSLVPCFIGEGDHWSFAKPSSEDSNIIIEIVEKKRISNFCSIGTYAFSSVLDFKNLLSEYEDHSGFSERYIAPFLNYMIQKGFIVQLSQAKKPKLFGTPYDLCKTFDINMNELISANSSITGFQRETLVVDIDETLCTLTETKNYSDAIPIKEHCEALQRADKMGSYIILFTSRNMRSFQSNIGLINKYTLPQLIKWLNKHQIPYDEIQVGKPWGTNVKYIDDKSYSLTDFSRYGLID